MNPIVGPEPICASSRMKGGSCTKILLDLILGIAVSHVYNIPYNIPNNLSFSTSTTPTTPVVEEMEDMILAGIVEFDQCRRSMYENDHVNISLASIVHQVGASYKNGGHLYYVGVSTAGILGCIDASEMPDT